MIKRFRYLPHLPLGVVIAAGGLVLGLSEEPSARAADDVAMGVIRKSIPDDMFSPTMLSSAVDAALRRARVADNARPVTVLRHADMPDLTGLSSAQPAPTLAHLDASITDLPATTTTSDVAVAGLSAHLNGEPAQAVAPEPAAARGEGSPPAAVSDENSLPLFGADRAARIEKLSVWLARYYRADQTSVARYVGYALDAGKRHGLDPMLIIAVMSIESSLNPRARSHKDARGLMQVLVAAHKEKFERFGGIGAAFKPKVSIDVGATILKGMIERTGSVEKALKHYVGAANLRSDGGYGAKVIRQRDRIWAAALGREIPVKPELEAATLRANLAQNTMASRVTELASSD